MWSRREISKMLQALRSFPVSLMSALLGLGLPLGWLWKRIIAVALQLSASLTMRLWSIGADMIVPTVIIFLVSGILAALRKRTHDSSWSRALRSSCRKPAACEDSLIGVSEM